jgi:O-antigen/teichoic acid export membrane protein
MGVAGESLTSTRDLILLAGALYATVLSMVFMPSITTLIVIQRTGPVPNAHYSLPAMIAAGLCLFLYSVVRWFPVEASHELEALRQHANSAIRVLVVVVVPSVVLECIFAPQYLRIFDDAYATKVRPL